MHENIAAIVIRAGKYMKRQGFSQKNIDRHAASWKKVLSFADSTGASTLNRSLITKIGVAFDNETLRHACNLFEFATDGRFRYEPRQYIAPERFAEVIEDYRKDLTVRNLSDHAVKSRITEAKKLLCSLSDKVGSVDEISLEQIVAHLNALKESQAPKSLSVIRTRIEDFIKFLSRTRTMSVPLEKALAGKRPRAYPVLPTLFSVEELALIIDAAAASRNSPKKKTVLILLASVCSMRAMDAISLRLEAIDLNCNLIHIHQGKNGEPISIPLLPQVKTALLDYIENERPDIGSDNLFLTDKPPHVPYVSVTVLHNTVTDACRRAGIDISSRRHGSHSLRHSFSTAMLNDGASYSVVNSHLGHTMLTSTAAYLHFDEEKLRTVALEVPPCSR